MIIKNYSQPYLYKKKTSIDLLCCYADYSVIDTFHNKNYKIKPWKIHNINNIEQNFMSTRLNLPDYIPGHGKVLLECNPCVYSDNNLFTCTFGFKENSQSAIRYCVVGAEILGDELKNFQVLSRSFNGVLHNNFLYCIASQNKDINILDIENNKIVKTSKIITNNHSSIARITKIFDSNEFIVTIGGKYGDKSIIIDEDLQFKKMLTDNGKNLYKCSLYKNYLAYTIKDDNELRSENRSVKIIKY